MAAAKSEKEKTLKEKPARKPSFKKPVSVRILDNLPRVALLGRPNVGKSTLFNRLIRSNRAITHDMPGVTRDRMEGLVRQKGYAPFVIVDTGGITLDAHATTVEGPAGIRGFEEEILRQAKLAVEESAVLCLVVDARDGLTPFDAHLADYLRRAGRPLFVAVNKIDGHEKSDYLMAEFHVMGLPLLPVSAEHGYNISGLLDEMYSLIPDEAKLVDDEAVADEDAVDADITASMEQGEASESESGDIAEIADDSGEVAAEGSAIEPAGKFEEYDENAPVRFAMLGRPNVGKSSLVNAFAKEDRMIVSDVAGTTRDSVDVAVVLEGITNIFVDSAGVRRRSKITDSVERFSVNSALKTSTKAHVTLLVLDGQEGLTVQDKRLMELLDERKLPFIVLVNKIDLLDPKELAKVEKTYREELAYCPHVPLLMVSAHSRRGLKKILPLAREIIREAHVRVGTGQLNRILEDMLQRRQPPLIKQRRAKFYYMTQAESNPPTFVFFVSDIERVPTAYQRYLERSLRQHLGIKHAPVRVRVRSSGKDRHKK